MNSNNIFTHSYSSPRLSLLIMASTYIWLSETAAKATARHGPPVAFLDPSILEATGLLSLALGISALGYIIHTVGLC